MSNTRVRSPTSRRTLRVTQDVAGWLGRRAGLVAPPSASEFVLGILRRYDGRRAIRAPLERFCRRGSAMLALTSHFHRHQHWLGLHLERHLHRPLRERIVQRSSLVWRVAAPPAATATAAAPAPAFVERIFSRERRIESTATIQSLVERVVNERHAGRPGAEPAIARIKAAPAIPMLVRKPPAPPTSPEQIASPRTEGFATESWGSQRLRARNVESPEAAPFSPAQISRLTDQVVNAIDRRFTAHRERHGRI